VSVPLLTATQRWACPNCTATDVTHLPPDAVASRFHACAGLRGLTAPMVPAGTRCKVEAVERQDYVADELVTTDADGRPVMAVRTTRDDGTDVAVFAPCATARGEGYDGSR
jgi:hypothetical protein